MAPHFRPCFSSSFPSCRLPPLSAVRVHASSFSSVLFVPVSLLPTSSHIHPHAVQEVDRVPSRTDPSVAEERRHACGQGVRGDDAGLPGTSPPPAPTRPASGLAPRPDCRRQAAPRCCGSRDPPRSLL